VKGRQYGRCIALIHENELSTYNAGQPLGPAKHRSLVAPMAPWPTEKQVCSEAGSVPRPPHSKIYAVRTPITRSRVNLRTSSWIDMLAALSIEGGIELCEHRQQRNGLDD
jgi:hypothetical protein